MTDEIDSIAFRGSTETIQRVTATDPDSKGGGDGHYDGSPSEDGNSEKKDHAKSGMADRHSGAALAPVEPAKLNDEVRLSSYAQAILNRKTEGTDRIKDVPTEESQTLDEPTPKERNHVDFFA